MPLQIKVAGKSDVGLVRSANEDCLHLDEKNNVFAVCDGMGGHQAGEVASMMAVEIIDIIFNHFQNEINEDSRLAVESSLPRHGTTLVKAIRLANRAIFNTSIQKPTLMGMGTTVVALAFDGNMMSVAHVGDSRAYKLTEKGLEPLTADHSWVAEIQKNQNLSPEEASNVVGKNVITRALGVRETVTTDYRLVRAKPGDRFMICSDGLCGYADDDEIFAVIKQVRDDNQKIVDDLVQMANDRGGADNVSVAVVEIVEADESATEELDKFTVPAESNEVLAVQDEWLEKINAFIAQRSAAPEHNLAPKPVNKTALIIIFAAFIIVAALFIYFSLGK